MTGPQELDARGRRLRAALAAVPVPDNAPELRLMREWLDTWSGIALFIAGMTYQGWDVAAGRSQRRGPLIMPTTAAPACRQDRGSRDLVA